MFVPEAYSFDAVSQLGFIAARTQRLEIASGILQLYTRTPTLTAMTAAGLDYVSGGRFTLGIGASGPQVIEGWHGVPYDAPVGRTREIIEICRTVWRRERLELPGPALHDPAAARPRDRPRQAAQADQPPGPGADPDRGGGARPEERGARRRAGRGLGADLLLPGEGGAGVGRPLAAGRARRDPSLPPLDVVAQAPLAIGEDVAGYLELRLGRSLALYIGGMGPHRDRGRNFYYELAVRYGFEAAASRCQDAYLAGRKDEAAALVPAELLAGTSLIGPEGHVAERLAALKESGVTTLNVTPLAATHADRVRLIEKVRDLAA